MELNDYIEKFNSILIVFNIIFQIITKNKTLQTISENYGLRVIILIKINKNNQCII